MCEPDFEFIYGAYIPVIYALAASRYLSVYQATEKDLGAVAVAAREWAIRNPQAIRHTVGPISLDDVLASRPIASPFHLLDCSSPCEGGGAFLVTTPERARDLTDQPAFVLGTGAHHSHSFISQAPDLIQTGAVHSGRAAFAQAGLTADDVDVVELYDAFTINPLLCLEDLGFCGRGEAGDFVLEGRTSPGGSLPMNTNGGLLSFGHTGDASGLSVLVEGARQVMGTAGCQVDSAEHALVHTYGGMMGEHYTVILGRTA